MWGTFCDWYVEFTKPILQGEDPAARAETQAMTAWVLGQVLRLLHPVMPFITEELWQHFAGEDAGLLIAASWPELSPDMVDAAAAAEIEWVVAAISAIRAARAEINVPPGIARALALVKDARAGGGLGRAAPPSISSALPGSSESSGWGRRFRPDRSRRWSRVRP